MRVEEAGFGDKNGLRVKYGGLKEHQQKFRLHQMRQPCILTQATSDLHPVRPEHHDGKCATWLHPVLSYRTP